MNEYILKTVIPTESEAKGMLYREDLYFSSHTNLYRVKKNNLSIFTAVEGTIKHFSVNGENAFICTTERVFMTYHERIIGSIRRTASCIDSNESIFAIGVGNILEVWKIPTEYQFMLFKQQNKLTGHQRPIKIIKILDYCRIITASDDCSVRLFDIEKKTSVNILTIPDHPSGLFMINETDGVVTCKNGTIMFFNIIKDVQTPQVLRLNSRISSSASFRDLLVCATEETYSEQAPEEKDAFHFIKDDADKKENNQPRPIFKKREKKYFIILYKGTEEIRKIELESRVNEMCCYNGSLAIKTDSFIGLYDINSGNFTNTIDIPKIINFDSRSNLIAAACSDNKVRLYNNHSCISVLQDPASKGDILATHLTKNSCISITKQGYISVFNTNDSNCYRSFFIGDSSDSSFEKSAISEDGCMLFASTTTGISVIDIQKSKLVEILGIDAPLINMHFDKDNLYYLDLKNQLIKYNLYSTKSIIVTPESTGINFAVRYNKLILSTSREIIFYDLDLVFQGSAGVSLESRHRDEIFSKPKPVSTLDVCAGAVICGGLANMIKVVKYSDTKHLYRNCITQKIRVSSNKEWENYKPRLDKEKKTEFNKKNLIEARKIQCCENKFYVLSREGIGIYELDKSKFNPIEFDIHASEDFVVKNLLSKNYVKALIASIQINNIELLKRVLMEADTPEYLVRFVPNTYASSLFDSIVELIRADFSSVKLFEYLKWMIYHFKEITPGTEETIREGIKNDYKVLKDTYFMLQNLSIKK